MAFDAINHVDDSDNPSDFRFQWDRNSMFSFYQLNVFGVASAVQTGVYKRVFEKSHAGAIRFSIRRIEARSIIVSEVCTRYS